MNFEPSVDGTIKDMMVDLTMFDSPLVATPEKIKVACVDMSTPPSVITANIDLLVLGMDDEACVIGEEIKASGGNDDVELIHGLLGRGPWRRLKGGITMDSGFAIDTMPGETAPGCKLLLIPSHRKGRKIVAANGTRIKEHGVRKLKFSTNAGQKLSWDMVPANVKKALKSVAVTCDGVETGECEVRFTKRGGYIFNVETGEAIDFNRTGNTYGMDAWVHVGNGDEAAAVFARPATAP